MGGFLTSDGLRELFHGDFTDKFQLLLMVGPLASPLGKGRLGVRSPICESGNLNRKGDIPGKTVKRKLGRIRDRHSKTI